MNNQEEHLRTYLHSALRDKVPLTVLQLKISELDEALRTEQTLNTIVDSFKEPLYPYGRAFCVSNDDIFIAYSSKTKENEIQALLIKAWLWFSGDSKTTAEQDKLQRRFSLPEDKTSLFEELRRISDSVRDAPLQKTDAPRKKFVLPPSRDRNQKHLTPEILSRITKALAGTDFANMIRRQSVCVILDDIQPQPMFEEVFVAIADLGETLLPDVSLTATPWLFQDLTETLDKRVLSSVSRHDDGSFTHDFSLNLNVSTILSEDFRNFDYNIRSGMKSSIVLELQPIDIFSDLTSYLLARDYAQNLGYKICIDGVTDKSLRFIDRERLGADLLKLVWTPELPEAIESDPLLQDRLRNMGANRAILCRVDDEHALKFGKAYDVCLFQGRYVQNLLANDLRRRRVGTTLLRK
ncbi:MAG: hypothetical protein ACI4PW_07425 [Alphaproteobacteria bacterium]